MNSPDLVEWARPILQEANFLRLAERLEDLLARLGHLANRSAAATKASSSSESRTLATT
jgi:hypothetical protein